MRTFRWSPSLIDVWASSFLLFFLNLLSYFWRVKWYITWELSRIALSYLISSEKHRWILAEASVCMPAMEVATLSWELSHGTNQIKIRKENASLATANEGDPMTHLSGFVDGLQSTVVFPSKLSFQNITRRSDKKTAFKSLYSSLNGSMFLCVPESDPCFNKSAWT